MDVYEYDDVINETSVCYADHMYKMWCQDVVATRTASGRNAQQEEVR